MGKASNMLVVIHVPLEIPLNGYHVPVAKTCER